MKETSFVLSFTVVLLCRTHFKTLFTLEMCAARFSMASTPLSSTRVAVPNHATGVELCLYYLTIRTILRNMKSRKRRRSDEVFVAFSTVLLFFNTVFVVTQALFGQEMWIIHKDYPNGPSQYLHDYASVWYQTFGTAASILLNLFSDALLVSLLMFTRKCHRPCS